MCFFDRILERTRYYFDKLDDVFLIFDTKSEQKLFNAYIPENKIMFEEEYAKQEEPFIDEHSFNPDLNLKTKITHFQEQIKTGRVLNKMLVEFRKSIVKCSRY
jgi:hypothetical protein